MEATRDLMAVRFKLTIGGRGYPPHATGKPAPDGVPPPTIVASIGTQTSASACRREARRPGVGSFVHDKVGTLECFVAWPPSLPEGVKQDALAWGLVSYLGVYIHTSPPVAAVCVPNPLYESIGGIEALARVGPLPFRGGIFLRSQIQDHHD
ncbi:hypothetical protein EMCG_03125 [[Emmonsia] crescens]|uniref:Uncharacterized protein n=1 Tax=[Emmonsia] crescens TaxID=73230 RepID=A0A0G2HW60_9EURO|nr:hypothetical protein EMCG_03125 [Emmonsia crescens UAMH 3008]